MTIIPNVAINGCTFLFVMRRPLTRPTSIPKNKHTPVIGKKSEFCPSVMWAIITVTVDITDATERSKPPPPINITNVCPMLTIPKAAD